MKGVGRQRPAASSPAGGRGRWLRSASLVLVTALAATLVPAPAAEAVSVRTHSTERVLGSVQTQRIEVRLSGGAIARGNLLRFDPSDPDVALRPRLARGTIVGTETFTGMARREAGRGGVAGVNGGYWLPRPWGAPNGLFIDRGTLLSGQAVNSIAGGGRPTGRGMVGWRNDGGMVMDRIEVALHLERTAAGFLPERFDEINRQVWPESESRRRPNGELLLYDQRFGTSIAAPAGAVVATIDGLRVRSSGATAGTVSAVRELTRATSLTVPDGTHLVVAYGRRAEALRVMVPGEPLEVRTVITPESGSAVRWENLDSGVAGGQLLVRDGRRRPATEWTDLAAFGSSHTARNPRTAIGRMADGRVLLVTIDGRRRGWSVGASMRELADIMLALGAVDAVNLDGGGSTTMAIDGRVRNRPSETGRSVADGLFITVPRPTPARSLDEACSPQVVLVGTGFRDVPGTTHAASIGCLAGWGVTTGVTPTSFAPSADITRAQMAAFLARWIDDIAARGTGRPLPEVTSHPFRDVPASSIHRRDIARLAEAGIITGRTSTTFAPGAPVTRAQTASMVSAAIRHVTGSALPRGRDSFVDDNGSAHEANIDRLSATGIVTGVGGFRYDPGARVTRGAMASVLMRASALLVADGVVPVPGEGPVLAGDGDPAGGLAGGHGADGPSDLDADVEVVGPAPAPEPGTGPDGDPGSSGGDGDLAHDRGGGG